MKIVKDYEHNVASHCETGTIKIPIFALGPIDIQIQVHAVDVNLIEENKKGRVFLFFSFF